MQLFYADEFVLPLPPGHRFPMAKYRRLRERVIEGIPDIRLRVPPAASPWELACAHDPRYVERVLEGKLTAPEIRRIGFPWSLEMVERSRRSVGGTLAAARGALVEGVSGNLAGGTHHAGRDIGEGYCVFNDVAVTARTLLAEGKVGRVAIIDADVHQGNGTAAILGADREVFTFSVHGERNFPFRKSPSHLDIALPDGANDSDYLDAIGRGLKEAVSDWRPDLVLYIAGADPFEGDTLGRLAVTEAGLRERDRQVLRQCESLGIPLAICMGGGYAPDVEVIVSLHFTTFALAAEGHRRAQRLERA
ncbi:MAG: histone deacetylase [Myxococcota bacterium]